MIFSVDFSSLNISCWYLLTILAQDLCISTPASISFPLHLLAKVYFIIFLYFITSLNIVIVVPIVAFTSAHTFHIGYLTFMFAYHCIPWETLWKPHADTESLHIIFSLIYLPQIPWTSYTRIHTHTPFYSPLVPTDYIVRSLQGVSIIFTNTWNHLCPQTSLSSKQSKLYRMALLYFYTYFLLAGVSRMVTSISKGASTYHPQHATLLSPLCMNPPLQDMEDTSAPKLLLNMTFGGQASPLLSMPLSQVTPLVSKTKWIVIPHVPHSLQFLLLSSFHLSSSLSILSLIFLHPPAMISCWLWLTMALQRG